MRPSYTHTITRPCTHTAQLHTYSRVAHTPSTVAVFLVQYGIHMFTGTAMLCIFHYDEDTPEKTGGIL